MKNEGSGRDVSARVLLVPPTKRDGEVTCALMKEAGIECEVRGTLKELIEAMEEGAGAVMLTEEALAAPGALELAAYLEGQPAWSDMPVVMLMRGANESPVANRVLEQLKNVTLLERPAPMRSLVSAVRTALRGRQRQYQIREQMEEIRAGQRQRQQLLENERAARVEAEHISRMKDEFLATLSHELRTPLNAIFGWTQLLKQGPGDAEIVAEGVAVIDRNVRMQTQLIEDLLDMSRIISGKVRLVVKDVNLGEVISAAVEVVQAAADAKGIRLVKEVGIMRGHVRGDAGRLQQVFWNLLANAIKFTPRGGEVRVSAREAEGGVRVEVTDTGEGISAEFLPQVFQRFSQADASTTRKHAGLGLGLSIVKSLVEMHGGTVAATSGGAGKGTSFVVELPVGVGAVDGEEMAASGGRAKAGREMAVMLRGIKVLVVDDEPDARDVVRRFLISCEAVPALAASAAEANEVLARFKPDVILSDIGMPGEDGYTFMRGVRAGGNKTPAVAVTAFARREDRDRSLEAGFQRHLPKPLEPRELAAVIAELARG